MELRLGLVRTSPRANACVFATECGNKRTRVTENERKAKEDADYESWKLKILNENGT